METVKKLLDKWSEFHSQRELAGLLGVTEQRISEYKSGVRAMPDAQFAELAKQVEGLRKAKSLLWEYVHAKTRVKEKISEGFNYLLSIGKPHGALLLAV